MARRAEASGDRGQERLETRLARDPDAGETVEPCPVGSELAAALLLLLQPFEATRVGLDELARGGRGDGPGARAELGKLGQVMREIAAGLLRCALGQLGHGLTDGPLLRRGDPALPVRLHRRGALAASGIYPRPALPCGQPQILAQLGGRGRDGLARPFGPRGSLGRPGSVDGIQPPRELLELPQSPGELRFGHLGPAHVG